MRRSLRPDSTRFHPPKVARKAESVGVTKAGMATFDVFALSVLAGAFIALGAIFATTIAAGGVDLPYGFVRLLAGLVFTLGLILVVVAGAELFIGNNLIVMAWTSRQVCTKTLSEQYTFGAGEVGRVELSIAVGPRDEPWLHAGDRPRDAL